MALASGEYIQFLNAGDIFFDPTSLSHVMPYLDGDNDVIFGDIYVTDKNYKKIYHVKYCEFNLTRLKTRGTATCNHQAFFVKKSKAPQYSERYKLKAELNWYIDIALNENIYCKHIKLPLVKYTIGGLGYTNFWTNLYEWVCVVQRRFGTVQNVRNVGTYWRFIKYRYPALKKYFK